MSHRLLSWKMVLVLFVCLSPASSVQGQIPTSSPIVTPSGVSIRDAIESDVNGDGHLDLVSVNGQGEITINYGFGTGAHGNRQQIDPGPGIDGLVRCLGEGDLDGDGDRDLAYGWATSGGPGGFISVFINDGGTLGPRQDIPLDTQINRTPYDLILSDVDGDGRDDLVCCTNMLAVTLQTASLTVLRSLGAVAGGGLLFAAPEHDDSSSLATDILLHDMDGDGDQDALMASRDGNVFSAFNNDGNGAFSLATSIFFPLLPHPYSLLAADFTGDGNQDVIIGTWMTKSLILLEGDGNFGFIEYDEIPVGVLGWGLMQRLGSHDMDLDGTPDVIAPFSGGIIATRFNGGTAEFLDETLFSSYQGPLEVRFSDFDEDGLLDLWMDHSDLQVFTNFLASASRVGYFHFEPQRVSSGLEATIPLMIVANRAIEGFEVGIEIDRSLLQPIALEPSAEVMAVTGPSGPAQWFVDLGSAPGDRVLLLADLGLGSGMGLDAGTLNEAADLILQVATVSGLTETTVFPSGVFGSTDAAIHLSGGVSSSGSLSGATITIEVPQSFIRADANDNGLVNIADAVVILRRMFGIDSPGSCQAAEDVNGNGIVDVADAISLVTFLFAGANAPAAPFPSCDIAPDPLILPCEVRISCP